MTRKEKIKKARGEILALTDKERLLLLLMIADFSKGKVFYNDAPKKLKDIFIGLFPKAAKCMTDE